MNGSGDGARPTVAVVLPGGGARGAGEIGALSVLLAAHMLGIYRVSLASLLDPTPLRKSLDRWTDWRMLARNVERGVLDSVCVVATSLASGGPVAFVACRDSAPGHHDGGLRYVRTRLRGEHVRALAASRCSSPRAADRRRRGQSDRRVARRPGGQ